VRNFLELKGVEDLVVPVVEEEEAAGRRVYLAPVGGSIPEGSMEVPLGALGYVEAFMELHEQARELGVPLDTVILATGSAGTQAGLLVGAKLVSPETRVVGISVAGEATPVAEYVRTIADGVLEALGAPERVGEGELVVLDDYLGEGYGMMNQGVADAIRTTARHEGVLLDPVYTGKSMAGLLDLVRKGEIGPEEGVVFLHTGGTPALFPYRDEIVALIEAEE
jgi:1-aminocyclopropane-1-carboxylate deaminase/D-cysteine desulfhydrase-like pyridoxal-dependent ACC family enzyme